MFLLAYIDRWKEYHRLVFSCTVKTAMKVKCLCVSSIKHGTVVGLLRFSRSFLFACAASHRANFAFKTTIIEDTHLTLIGIPFKLEANNSLIFCHYKHMTKKFAEFPFLFIFIIPWFNAI